MRDGKEKLLLRVLDMQETDRVPFWLMRQAGRILPEYRAVRNSLSGFIELVQNPNSITADRETEEKLTFERSEKVNLSKESGVNKNLADTG